MGKFQDLTGMRFGKLVVIKRVENYISPKGYPQARWLCRCDCENEKIVTRVELCNGGTRSCGCLVHDKIEQKIQSMIGRVFGRLTVIEQAEDHIVPSNGERKRKYKCLCECGNYTTVFEGSLLRGITKSCGCLGRELTAERARNSATHGATRNKTYERLYRVWHGIIERCEDPKNSHYSMYGARGIKMCDEWRNNYAIFREWALANGYDKDAPYGKCTIDRIDIDGDYCPENCRWTDLNTQARNKSNNLKLTLNGVTKTAMEWAEIVNLSYSAIKSRKYKGYTDEEALLIPFGGKRKHGSCKSSCTFTV